MELYQLYNSATLVFSLFNEVTIRTLVSGAILGAGIWAVLFVLQGFGLYTMAKNRGMQKSWLAFVPFANVWYIGKLTGDCFVFGQRVKRAGLYTMLAQIIATLACALYVAMQMYLYAVVGAPNYREEIGYYWITTGFSATAEKIYTISGYVMQIMQLVYEVLLLILLFGLYKRYYPKNYMFLGILSLFIPMSRYIAIFVLRKRQAIDYERYMQARREAYMRQQQQYYNTYGNPYGYNSYNRPYGQNGYNGYGYNQPPRPEPEDPFSEFGGKKDVEKDDEPFEDFSSSSGKNQDNPFDEF